MKKEERNYRDWLKIMRQAAWISIVCIVVLMGIIITICIYGSKMIATYISNEDLCYAIATITLIIVVIIGGNVIKMCLETINECKESNFNALVERILEREEESINSEMQDED